MQILLTIVLFILFAILGLLIWILVAPLIIKIDSNQQIYELRLKSIAHVNVLFEMPIVIIDFHILFFKKRMVIDLFKTRKPKKKEELEKKNKKKRSKSYSFSKMRHKAKKVLQSFQVKKLWLNIDTDDYYYNAFLFPVFFFIKGKNHQLNINYQGENELILIVKNRLIRILFAFIF